MRRYLFVMVGVEAFTVYAESRRAARVYGLELLGYAPGMESPRCTAVAIAAAQELGAAIMHRAACDGLILDSEEV